MPQEKAKHFYISAVGTNFNVLKQKNIFSFFKHTEQ